jgi:hypothetical protein
MKGLLRHMFGIAIGIMTGAIILLAVTFARDL